MKKNNRFSLSLLPPMVLCAAFVLSACAGAPLMMLQPAPQRGQPFAQVNLPKPRALAATPVSALPAAPEIQPAATQSPMETDAPLLQPQVSPAPQVESFSLPQSEAATPSAQLSAEEQAPPGAVSAAIVPDTPTPEYKPDSSASSYAAAGGEHWIDVDLSQQRVYAYAGDTLVNSFLVSTGTWQTPTVTGRFKIWIKLRSTTMSGPGYYLTNVPYVMYFYQSYGLHGTYWHNNFGTPMSHGCVNLSIPDAEWLYNFASVGTVVNVHY